MFAAENGYARQRRKSVTKGHDELNLNGQRHWRPDEAVQVNGRPVGINLPGRCVYAQNEAYLELCNPGWDDQWRAGFGSLCVVPTALFVIWAWYGFAVHPLLFNRIIIFIPPAMDYPHEAWPLLLMGWLVAFPLALGILFTIHKKSCINSVAWRRAVVATFKA